MRALVLLLLTLFFWNAAAKAQSVQPSPEATEILQPSQSDAKAPSLTNSEVTGKATIPAPAVAAVTLKVPAGTVLDVEAAYTVSSINVRPGDLISFRVLIPVIIDGSTVIEEGALVTARVTVAKRGGHWGKAGRLAWAMEDVVAADNTRILLDPITTTRNLALWSLEDKTNSKTSNSRGQGRIKGDSHKGEVATRTIIAAAIFPPLAPLALMHGFKRGENAVLTEGRRYMATVRNETSVVVKPKH